MKKFLIIFFTVSVYFAQKAETICNPQNQEQIGINFWKYKEGDNSIWSQVDFNDSTWRLVSRGEFYTVNKGYHWLRTIIIFKENIKGKPIILRLGRIQSAFEVFWNGKLIGTNGKVGINEIDEKPGRLFFAASLDTIAAAGENTLAVRFSNYHNTPPGFFFYAKIDCSLNPNYYAYQGLLRITFNLGILVAGIAIGLALFFSGPRYKNYFFYFLLCLAMLVSLGFQFLMHNYNISMGVLKYFEPIYIGGFYLTEIAIALFILFSFDLPYKKYHVPFITISAIPFYLASFNYSTVLELNYGHYGRIIFFYVLGLIIYSCIKKKKGSYIALVGYLLYNFNIFEINILPLFSWFADDYYLPLFAIIYIMVANRQVHEQVQIQKSIELRAQRLETDLLKKSIQPHFIINTLSSIKSLAKRKPAEAEELIQALANEFRIINKISMEKEIPIMQEIELCRYHLKIMEHRWDAKYELTINNLCEKEKIPPLIFHTLIENGFTHAFKSKEDGNIWLSCKQLDKEIVYTLSNNGSLIADFRNNPGFNIEEGMGIKYIKSRLEESYPGRWNLEYGVSNSLWQVKIKIGK